MTRDEILALKGRELDRAVAEKVMRTSVAFMRIGAYPNYSSDANAARLVLAEVERRLGDVTPFIDEIDRILESPMKRGHHPEHCMWMAMMATPAQICRAALLSCMEVE